LLSKYKFESLFLSERGNSGRISVTKLFPQDCSTGSCGGLPHSRKYSKTLLISKGVMSFSQSWRTSTLF